MAIFSGNSTASRFIDYALVGLGIFVAALTYLAVNRQADIIAGTLKQMGEDAKLARDEFNATHRPRIIIYAFQIPLKPIFPARQE